MCEPVAHHPFCDGNTTVTKLSRVSPLETPGSMTCGWRRRTETGRSLPLEIQRATHLPGEGVSVRMKQTSVAEAFCKTRTRVAWETNPRLGDSSDCRRGIIARTPISTRCHGCHCGRFGNISNNTNRAIPADETTNNRTSEAPYLAREKGPSALSTRPEHREELGTWK